MRFKLDDNVQFVTHGSIGNMNKYMYDHNMFDDTYRVIHQYDSIIRIAKNGLYFDVPDTCLELVPGTSQDEELKS